MAYAHLLNMIIFQDGNCSVGWCAYWVLGGRVGGRYFNSEAVRPLEESVVCNVEMGTKDRVTAHCECEFLSFRFKVLRICCKTI